MHHSIQTLLAVVIASAGLQSAGWGDGPDPIASKSSVTAFDAFLETQTNLNPNVMDQSFASVPLTRSDADEAIKLLAAHRLQVLRTERVAEMQAREIAIGPQRMKFDFTRFGEPPVDGCSLYISLHGGGGAPTRVNDQQWENQKRLYQLQEGIYVAPRAPTDTWDLWHQSHIDPLLDRLIENLVALEGVNWNRVYVMGYSAGGDGVYQLAPRMADRWAGAAMMAGHPNETSPLGLRNVPFALQVGGKDTAYNRHETAKTWQLQLASLQAADPDGYQHLVKIYPDKGHWMDRQDAVAIPWISKFTRNPTPKKLVWKQDDVLHDQCYWLAVNPDHAIARRTIRAAVAGQTIMVSSETANSEVVVRLDDRIVDLDQPIMIESAGIELYRGTPERTIGTLAKTLASRGDPNLCFSSEVTVSLPAPFPEGLVAKEQIPHYSARRCKVAPIIDGKLDDAAWQGIAPTERFVDLITGQPTAHDTRAAITWDDDHLYVGFWISEPNVSAQYKERDDPIYYDNDVEIFIAGKDAYYEFEINAFGTIYEAFFVWSDAYDQSGYHDDPQLHPGVAKSQPFNGVGLKDHPRGKRIAFLGYDFPGLQSAVQIDGTLNDDRDVDQGWTVELAFPWQSMKKLAQGDGRLLPPKPGDTWSIDLFRFNKYKVAGPNVDSGGWAVGKHSVWDSHIPEIFPIVTFIDH